MALGSSFTSLQGTPHQPDPASCIVIRAARCSRERRVADGARSRRRNGAQQRFWGHERNRPPDAPGVRKAQALNDMADWNPLCRIDEIPVLGARRVTRERGAEVAVFRTADDRVFARLDRCPHKGGPLSQGIVFGHSVACPLHNWTIGLADGCARAPDEGCAVTFSVMCERGTVYLDRAELATRGLVDTFDGAKTGALGDVSAASSMAVHSDA